MIYTFLCLFSCYGFFHFIAFVCVRREERKVRMLVGNHIVFNTSFIANFIVLHVRICDSSTACFRFEAIVFDVIRLQKLYLLFDNTTEFYSALYAKGWQLTIKDKSS